MVSNNQRIPMSENPICYLEFTNTCNAKCISCLRRPNKILTRKLGFMTWDTFVNAVDGLVKLGVKSVECDISGEALLHPNCMDMLRYLGDSGIPEINITTNCIALTPEKTDELLTTPISTIYLSIHTVRKDIYKEFYGKDHLERVIKHVEYFLQQRNKIRPELRVELASLPIPLTEPYIHEVYDKFKQYNVNKNIETPNTMGSLRPDNVDWSILKGNPICGLVFRVIAIHWNGDVVSCHLDHNAQFVMGNVNDDALENIWKNDKFTRYRQEILNNPGFGICEKCSIRYNQKFMLYPRKSIVKKIIPKPVRSIISRSLKTLH